MNTLDSSLLERVEHLIGEHTTRELLSTSGMQATLDELVLRNRGLEEAVRELAAAVERLDESSKRRQ
jgi:hypothetical protein